MPHALFGWGCISLHVTIRFWPLIPGGPHPSMQWFQIWNLNIRASNLSFERGQPRTTRGAESIPRIPGLFCGADERPGTQDFRHGPRLGDASTGRERSVAIKDLAGSTKPVNIQVRNYRRQE
jgi:hypothetical protein